MKPRILHVITIYNGRSFVFRSIESAIAMSKDVADIDVLVLDDASPEPGFSQEVHDFCEARGVFYYLTPRNLGIPRNVSLGLLTAIEKNYDFVTINNSDVIFPNNLINVLIKCFDQKNVGSVTAWSNNVSIYTIPNEDPDRYLANQETVDFISQTFAEKYSSSVIDIPAGISFCIMMPVSVVQTVGLMDPIFGRGYCEETDWSLRSLKMGYRVCLAPGTFVYHQGRGSNLEAGLVSGAHSTVPENEVIIDKRYPNFRHDVELFMKSGVMSEVTRDALSHLTRRAAVTFGYDVSLNWAASPVGERLVQLKIDPSAHEPCIQVMYAGFADRRILQYAATVQHVIDDIGVEPLINNFCLELNQMEKDDLRAESVSYPSLIW